MFFLRLLQIRVSDKDPNDYVFARVIVLRRRAPWTTWRLLSRQIFSSINPNLSVVRFETFDAQIATRFTHERMLATLMTFFGGLALLLGTVGCMG